MNDRENTLSLDDLFRDLPREKAPEGFALRVAAAARRAEADQRARLAVRGRAWLSAPALSAAVVLLTLGMGTAGYLLSEARKAELVAQIVELRREHARLSQELTHLRGQVGGARPVIYLGGDDGVEYILDLQRLAMRRSHEPATGAESSQGLGDLTSGVWPAGGAPRVQPHTTAGRPEPAQPHGRWLRAATPGVGLAPGNHGETL